MGARPATGVGAAVTKVAVVVAGAYLGLVLAGCLVLALWGLSKERRSKPLRELA